MIWVKAFVCYRGILRSKDHVEAPYSFTVSFDIENFDVNNHPSHTASLDNRSRRICANQTGKILTRKAPVRLPITSRILSVPEQRRTKLSSDGIQPAVQSTRKIVIALIIEISPAKPSIQAISRFASLIVNHGFCLLVRSIGCEMLANTGLLY